MNTPIDCSYCHHNHNIKMCPKLLKKREEQEQLTKYRETDLTENFPKLVATQPVAKPLAKQSWVKLVKITGDPKVLQKVSELNASVKQQKEDAYQKIQQEKQRKQEEWLSLQITRQDAKEKKEKFWQLEHPIKMRAKYGPQWYQYVDQTDEDCNEADILRREADHQSYLKYQEYEDKREKEKEKEEELKKHNKSIMSSTQFKEWQDDYREEKMEGLDQEYEDSKFWQEIIFLKQANPENRSFYQSTGIMRSNWHK